MTGSMLGITVTLLNFSLIILNVLLYMLSIGHPHALASCFKRKKPRTTVSAKIPKSSTPSPKPSESTELQEAKTQYEEKGKMTSTAPQPNTLTDKKESKTEKVSNGKNTEKTMASIQQSMNKFPRAPKGNHDEELREMEEILNDESFLLTYTKLQRTKE
ncbi:unnamed protein product [Cylicocyclus nassatus]|uniref:Uncharacterized protein n=1 Tax=Cylicocyclus nassatus TaxID=53992 RepID=A0AA36H4Y7_CYLNA|nr:unnamed protein product [Cylicocyclus nassatus]